MKALSGEHVVFLPGLDGTGISYEPLSPFVADDADVTVVRYPTDRPLSFQETVECAAAQVEKADSALVVAESFSGPIAVELIASGKLEAKCLVLCATFARSPRPALLGIGLKLPLAAIMGLPIPEILLRPVMGGAEFSPAMLPLWRRVRETVSPNVLAHRLSIVNRVDVRGRLSALNMPCCYLQATGDMLVPSTAAADFTAAVPDIEIKRLQGPHFLLQARPKESMIAIEEFKKRTGTATVITNGRCSY